MKRFFLSSGFLSFLSGIFLLISFPGFYQSWAAWICLVPLLIAVRRAESRREALRAGLWTGLVFFGFSMHWFTYVHIVAWFGVTLIESCFMILFAISIYEIRYFKSAWFRSLWVAMAWTVSEFFRAEIPIFSLGWNLLGFSQSRVLPILQLAGFFGAYGLGFLIAWVNAVFYELLSYLGKPETEKKAFNGWRIAGLGLFAAGMVAVAVWQGNWLLKQPETGAKDVRISLIQGNIAQNIKWNADVRDQILQIYEKLTELASYDQSELAVWPEASFPGYFNHDPRAIRIRELARRLELPILVGSPHYENEKTAYNSAYFLDGFGLTVARYDKQKLVPFGEYIPLKMIFGWLEPVAYSLGVSDFSAGKYPVIFDLGTPAVRFSTLICFEDVTIPLARLAADQGAEFLAMITNDAWFGPTAAPFQHLDASIFRAVENGLPVVRAANTGVSAFISSKGAVEGMVLGREGHPTFSVGKETRTLRAHNRLTLYRRGGWYFPYIVSALFAFLFLFFVLRSIQNSRGRA